MAQHRGEDVRDTMALLTVLAADDSDAAERLWPIVWSDRGKAQRVALVLADLTLRQMDLRAKDEGIPLANQLRYLALNVELRLKEPYRG